MELKFILTSIDERTVEYDVGKGALSTTSAFHSAGYGDFVAIEHYTMKSFGVKRVAVSNIQVNGATFTSDIDAVTAINALIFWKSGSGGGFVVANDNYFTDPSARDSYFVENPEKLKEGIIVGVGDPIQYQRYNGSGWDDITGLVKGEKGDPGMPGIVQEIVAGANISIDTTDPDAPVISATGIQEESDPIWDSEKGNYLKSSDAEAAYMPLSPMDGQPYIGLDGAWEPYVAPDQFVFNAIDIITWVVDFQGKAVILSFNRPLREIPTVDNFKAYIEDDGDAADGIVSVTDLGSNRNFRVVIEDYQWNGLLSGQAVILQYREDTSLTNLGGDPYRTRIRITRPLNFPNDLMSLGGTIDSKYLPIHKSWVDITDKFGISSDQFVTVEILDTGVSRPKIRITGENVTAVNDTPLIITAPFGLGSQYDRTGNNAILADGRDSTGAWESENIEITQEVALTNKTTITVPPSVRDFSVEYYNGSIAPATRSLFDLQTGETLVGQTIDLSAGGTLPMVDIPDHSNGMSQIGVADPINRYNNTALMILYSSATEDGSYGIVVLPQTDGSTNPVAKLIYNGNGFGAWVEEQGLLPGGSALPAGWQSDTSWVIPDGWKVTPDSMISTEDRIRIADAWYLGDVKVI